MNLKNKRCFPLKPRMPRFGTLPAILGILLVVGLQSRVCQAETEGQGDLVIQAEQAYDKGQWEEALAHYTLLAQKRPDDPEVLFRLGNLNARLGRLREAAESYEKALGSNAQRARSWHNLGVVRVRQAIVALSEAQLAADAARETPPSRRLLDSLEFALGGRQDAPVCPAPEPREISAQQESPLPVNTLVAYSAARVNLRGGPGTQFARLAILPADTALTVRARQEGYAQVESASGQTGWLPLDLLRLGPASGRAKGTDER